MRFDRSDRSPFPLPGGEGINWIPIPSHFPVPWREGMRWSSHCGSNEFKMKKHTYRRNKHKKQSFSQSDSVNAASPVSSVSPPDASLLEFRPYQRRAFENKTSGRSEER